MSHYNDFFLTIDANLRKQLSCPKKLKEIRQRIIESAAASEIFHNPYETDESDLDEPICVTEEVVAEDKYLIREELIRAKQKEFGIIDEEDSTDKDVYGQTPAHIAVLMDDEISLRQYFNKGNNCMMPDNNGNTPYSVAIMYGKKEMIAVFRELGITA